MTNDKTTHPALKSRCASTFVRVGMSVKERKRVLTVSIRSFVDEITRRERRARRGRRGGGRVF